MDPVNSSLLNIIGNTPMVKLNCFDTGLCELFVKLENHNPGGSIKDEEVLEEVNKQSMFMIITNKRHFNH